MRTRSSIAVSAVVLGVLSLTGCDGADVAGAREDGIGAGNDYGLGLPVYRYEPARPYPDAAEVRLFVELDFEPDMIPIDERERTSGDALSPEERAKLDQAILRRIVVEPGVEVDEACIVPTHFFAYYDEQGERIGLLEITFHCEVVQASPRFITDIDTLAADYQALRNLVESMGHPIDTAP